MKKEILPIPEVRALSPATGSWWTWDQCGLSVVLLLSGLLHRRFIIIDKSSLETCMCESNLASGTTASLLSPWTPVCWSSLPLIVHVYETDAPSNDKLFTSCLETFNSLAKISLPCFFVEMLYLVAQLAIAVSASLVNDKVERTVDLTFVASCCAYSRIHFFIEPIWWRKQSRWQSRTPALRPWANTILALVQMHSLPIFQSLYVLISINIYTECSIVAWS